jgi:hypothetical protein
LPVYFIASGSSYGVFESITYDLSRFGSEMVNTGLELLLLNGRQANPRRRRKRKKTRILALR